MLVNLVDDNEKIPLSGRIVWITPKGAQNNKTAGVGVQFNSLDKGATRDKIEKLLAGALSSDRKIIRCEQCLLILTAIFPLFLIINRSGAYN